MNAGPSIIVIIAVGILMIGYFYWQHRRDRKQESNTSEASASVNTAQTSLAEKKTLKTEAASRKNEHRGMRIS